MNNIVIYDVGLNMNWYESGNENGYTLMRICVECEYKIGDNFKKGVYMNHLSNRRYMKYDMNKRVCI